MSQLHSVLRMRMTQKDKLLFIILATVYRISNLKIDSD